MTVTLRQAVAELRACRKTTPEIAAALGVPVADVEAVSAADDAGFKRIGDVLRNMADSPDASPAFRRALHAAADAGPDLTGAGLADVGAEAVASFEALAEKHVDGTARDTVEGRR